MGERRGRKEEERGRGGRKAKRRRGELEGEKEGETGGVYPVSPLTRTLISQTHDPSPDTTLGVNALSKLSGEDIVSGQTSQCVSG